MSKEIETMAGSFAELIKNYSDVRPYPHWTLQEIQNTVAFAIDLPLRIVQLDTVNKFSEKHKSIPKKINDTYAEFYHELEPEQWNPITCVRKLNKYVESDKLKELWRYLEENLWITEGSYSNPALTLLRELRPWQYWETLNVLRISADFVSNSKASTNNPLMNTIGNNALMLGVRQIRRYGGLLFAGPSWKWNSITQMAGKSGQEFTEEFIGQIISTFEQDKSPIHEQRIKRLGAIRAACTVADMSSRLNHAGHVFDMVGDAAVQKGIVRNWHQKAKLGSNHWVGAAQLGLLLADKIVSSGLRVKSGIRYRPPTLKRIDKTAAGSSNSGDVSSFGDAISIQAVPTDSDYWRMSFRDSGGQVEDWSGDDNLTGRLQYIEPQTSQHNGSALRRADRRLSSLVDKIATSRTYFLLERLRLFQFRLEDRLVAFPGISPQAVGTAYNAPPAVGFSHDSPISIEALQTIGYSLNVDVCAVYHYDPLQGGLRMWESFYRRPEHRAKSIEATADLMWKIRRDRAMRKRSLCYRALERGEAAIELRGENDVTPDGDESAPGSALAVPIQICERTWGILELRAESKHQFRNSTLRWAHDFGRIVGGILYSRWMDAQFHGLNVALLRVLGEENPDSDEAYNILCRLMAGIFMVETVSLWKRLPDQAGADFRLIYECKASVNHPRPERQPHELHKEGNPRGNTPAWVTADPAQESHRKSFGAEFIRSNDIWWTGNFETPTRGRPTGGSYVRDLRKSGYSEYGILKFRSSAGKYDGFMWFVSNRQSRFDKRWEELFRLFSDHVGMLLELIDSRSKLAGSMERDLVHEIGGYGVSIKQATDSLREYLDPLFESAPISTEARRLIHALADLHDRDALDIPGSRRFSTDTFRALQQLYKISAVPERTQQPYEIYAQLTRLQQSVISLESDVKALLARLRGERLAANKYEGEPIDLAAVFSDVAEAKRWGPEITYTGERSGPLLYMPYQELRNIIQNLVINATKYNVGRGPVRFTVFEQVREWVRIEIENIGWSVSEDEKDSMFLDTIRTSRAKEFWPNEGGGMGLAIVRRTAAKWNVEYDLQTSEVSLVDVNQHHGSIEKFKNRGGQLSDHDFMGFKFIINFDAHLLIGSERSPA